MSTSPSDADALISSLEAGVRSRRAVLQEDGTSRAAPYLTDNSTAADAFESYHDRIDALFNDKPAYQAVLKESPRHRIILWMTANGQSPQQIADALGITKQTVYTVRKQPWFREMFVRITTDMGKDSVTQLLKGEVLPSLQTLIEVRDNPVAKESDRIRAADSLLDRFLGKPTVNVNSDAKAPSDLPTEAAQLAEEARRIEAELKAAGGNQFFEPSQS